MTLDYAIEEKDEDDTGAGKLLSLLLIKGNMGLKFSLEKTRYL